MVATKSIEVCPFESAILPGESKETVPEITFKSTSIWYLVPTTKQPWINEVPSTVESI